MYGLNNKYIFNNKAKCQDCYRCVRLCPVNAIGIKDGQAFVDEEKCILCGKCVKECPQKAKYYRSDVEKVKELLNSDKQKFVLVAPSFAGIYSQWEIKRLPSILRRIGFDKIYEVSEAVAYVAEETKKELLSGSLKNCTGICSSCPSLVSFIEKYYPQLVDNLIPVVSPMIAHGRNIRENNKNAIIVFIGPCIAKKKEAERKELNGIIDAVLTFEELDILFNDTNVKIEQCETSDFDNNSYKDSKLFPIDGGFFKTANLDDSLAESSYIIADGFNKIENAVEMIINNKERFILDALVCEMGCLNGPGIDSDTNLFMRKVDLVKYSNLSSEQAVEKSNFEQSLKTYFRKNESIVKSSSNEKEIAEILQATGKFTPEDELNCGACGYNSCREKAIAVLAGMAETNMCVPYMRKLAESRTDKIISRSPNGIVILDDKLNIISMNDSFKRFFMCSNVVCGNSISQLMDPEWFEKLTIGDSGLIENVIRFEKYGLIVNQKLFRLKEENQYVGIFVDLTKSFADKNKLDLLKIETVRKAEELLEHQINMAQKLAKFLGESTAKGEELLENLIKITEDEQRSNSTSKSKWLWDIYTSK